MRVRQAMVGKNTRQTFLSFFEASSEFRPSVMLIAADMAAWAPPGKISYHKLNIGPYKQGSRISSFSDLWY